MVCRNGCSEWLDDGSVTMRIWITWEIQRRNRTVSAMIDADLHELNVKANVFLRYCICVIKTCVLLLKKRPSIVFAQSPSIVLATLAVSWGRLFNIPVVIDAHNAGLFPFGGTKKWAKKLVQYTIRNASLVIVSNRNLEKYVQVARGRAFVLPDPIPDLGNGLDRIPLKGKYNIIFVCTYAEDEPYIEVIKAAGNLDKDVYIYITGNSKRREKELKAMASPNVVITGFLSESEYIRTLNSADVVLALTTREDCLLCGAYEGVAAEKPLVVSNTKALREHFSNGALYVENEYIDIASKISSAIGDLETLGKEIRELKKMRIKQWGERKIELENILHGMEASQAPSVRKVH